SLLIGTFRLSTINPQLPTALESLLSRALTEKLGDVEVHKVGMMKNDRFDRALHLVALMAVSSDDVQHLAGNTVLVGQRDPTEGMPHLLAEFSLNHFARRVLVVLQRLADIRQECAGDEIIALNRNAAAERTLQHVRDGNALSRAGIEVL